MNSTYNSELNNPFKETENSESSMDLCLENQSFRNPHDPRPQTINKALELVKKSGTDYSALRTKGLGLSIALLGLAEIQCERLANLGDVVLRLEQKVFSNETLNDLDAKAIVNLYSMATRSLNESSQYIQTTVQSTKWEEIETQLVQMAVQSRGSKTESSIEVAQVAQQLLNLLSQSAIVPGNRLEITDNVVNALTEVPIDDK